MSWCRFQALRELMPGQDKMDKASFLMNAVEYIRQLQACIPCRPPSRDRSMWPA